MPVKKKPAKKRILKRTTVCKTTTAKSRKKVSSGEKGKLDEVKLNQMIQERAYYIWEERNRPIGQDADIWSQAEKDILRRAKK